MNSRRGFFKSLAKAAAVVALAPQIAFRVRPEVPRVEYFWYETERSTMIVDQEYSMMMTKMAEFQRKWVEEFLWPKHQQQLEQARASSPS